MTRPVALIVVAAIVLVALAVAISERRVQAGFDAVRQEGDGQLERVAGMARLESLVGQLGRERDGERRAAAHAELLQTLAGLRAQLGDASDARRATLERVATLALAAAGDDGRDEAPRAAATRAAIDDFVAAEARWRAHANERVERAQHEATGTLRLALTLSALLTLILGLALSLRLVVQATRLAASAERIARGNLDAPVPPTPGALGQLAPAVRRTAAALARRERETEALVALAALPALPADDDAIELHGDAPLARLLEDVRRAVLDVLDVRALTLLSVDGERVHRLGTSQRERRDAHYARAGSAVAAMMARGDAVVFDVDRGVHPEDATARAAGARAYAVVPLDASAPAAGALVVDLGLCAVAVAELRFLRLVAHELSGRLAALSVARAPTLAQDRRSARSS